MSKLTCLLLLLSCSLPCWADEADLTAGHPRPSYSDVGDIDSMERALRKSLAQRERYSFSRGWWAWDRLRARYVDGGLENTNELRILRAVFRGLILDWHAKLEAKGEGDLFYIFFVTTAPGNKSVRKLGGRTLVRDLHGGGYHGGWGGAARMRIYDELVRAKMLTDKEKARFRQIVHQSLSSRFLDFSKGSQKADNHSFGNAGGVALALKLFPDAPQAEKARAWLDRIWKHFADFGDWREWTFYPYGPIFLHGLLDVAEATGRLESERALLESVGRRALGFLHSGGVRGNPNSGARHRKDLGAVYADPWNVGYFDIEQSPREGHFWYRLAQHFESPEFLWAAEQVALGGRPADGKVPDAYRSAYQNRFGWFVRKRIRPKSPTRKAFVGLLSPSKKKIPERLYLTAGSTPESPFAAFFLYEHKDAHLDNVSGHLYEYSVDGSKFLHTSGKYNNVYSGDTLRGGGTGEESLDLLLVVHKRHRFPLHPDRKGDERDFMRRGSLRHSTKELRAENNDSGDSFGRFGFTDYYGRGSRWIRETVLTKEGYLIVADTFVGGSGLADDYVAGPVWHLAPIPDRAEGPSAKNWFEAPALARAWWQSEPSRVLLHFHDDGSTKFGSVKQTHSQDTQPNRTVYSSRPIRSGRSERFLSVFVPHPPQQRASELATQIQTRITANGVFETNVGSTSIVISAKGTWSVKRKRSKNE